MLIGDEPGPAYVNGNGHINGHLNGNGSFNNGQVLRDSNGIVGGHRKASRRAEEAPAFAFARPPLQNGDEASTVPREPSPLLKPRVLGLPEPASETSPMGESSTGTGRSTRRVSWGTPEMCSGVWCCATCSASRAHLEAHRRAREARVTQPPGPLESWLQSFVPALENMLGCGNRRPASRMAGMEPVPASRVAPPSP